MSLLELIEVFGLGLSVGLVSTFLGLGGGLVIVPILPWISSLNHVQAVATSLFTIFFVVSRNTWMFHRQNRVSWSVAFMVGPTTAVFSFLAGWWAPNFSEAFLKSFLLGIFALVFFRTLNLLPSFLPKGISPRSRFTYLGLGTVAGLTSGLGGVGAGLILTPYLLVSKWVKSEEVAPTSNAIMMMTTFSGALSFMLRGWSQDGISHLFDYVKWQHAVMIFTGALITGLVGRRFQHRLSDQVRKTLLLLLLFALMLRIVWQLIVIS